MVLSNFIKSIVILSIVVLASCAKFANTNVQEKNFTQTYLVQGYNQYLLKTITSNPQCPKVQWDNDKLEVMGLRVGPQNIPMRKKSEMISADFPVLSCEILWPKNVKTATVGNQQFQLPDQEIKRILIIADTGCRLKASEDYYQDCNNELSWPFAKVMQSATKMNPDLVLHIGDIHYRESPCPSSREGCKNAAWGYGFDAWKADFFVPAKPLLEKAPWIFVRGNHEVCSRAGQGWHRFIDTNPWQELKSCNDPSNDQYGDYSEPYAVSLGQNAQILVFDSAKNGAKPIIENDPSYPIYKAQLQKIDNLALTKKFSIFTSHHPINVVLPAKKNSSEKNYHLFPTGYTNILTSLNGSSLFKAPMNLTMHGHNHIFESITYEEDKPAEIVAGNTASSLEEISSGMIQLSDNNKKQLKIKDFKAYQDFGFGTLDRLDESGKKWLFTEFDINGNKLFSCQVFERTVKCN